MVKTILRNGADLFFRKQTTILSAASIISLTYLLSALLGLIRDRLMAGLFNPHLLGIYWAADRIPSFIFNLVVVGALSSSFIPVFTKLLSQSGRELSGKTASVIVNVTLGTFALFSLSAMFFSRPLASLIAPQGSTEGDLRLLSELLTLLFLSQLFLLLSNFVTSILQSFQRFLLPALSPVIYNLGVVLGIVLLSSRVGVYAVAYGTIIGSLLHLLIQLPLLPALGIRYSFSLNFRLKGVAEVWRLMLPRVLGIAAGQISALVDTILAASISFASVAYFTLAQHLQNLPVSLFGAAIAQAALPILSVEANQENYGAFKKQLLTALYQMTFLLVPASVVLLVLRLPAVRLAFGAALFDWTATVQTGYVLAFFTFSILAQAVIYLLARGFYALRDTATPVKISLLAVGLNVVLSLFLVKLLVWPVWSLALSVSLSSIFNALALAYLLNRRLGGFGMPRAIIPMVKINFAGLLMALSIYLPLKILDRGAWGKYLNPFPVALPVNFDILILDTRYTGNLVLLTVISAVSGMVVYLLTSYYLKVEELNTFWSLTSRLSRRLTVTLNRLLSAAESYNG